jgi:nucleotide-binding universal stress UspA family protein
MTTTLAPQSDETAVRKGRAIGPGGRRRRVVVGVDGSEGSKEALRWAAREAQLRDASLAVVMCWEYPIVPYGVWAFYDAGLEAKETLDRAVYDVLGVGEDGDVTVTVVEGRPGMELLEQAKNADLLVLGTRGRGLFAGLLLGSVSQHCVAHASCPVVVVPHCGQDAVGETPEALPGPGRGRGSTSAVS